MNKVYSVLVQIEKLHGNNSMAHQTTRNSLSSFPHFILSLFSITLHISSIQSPSAITLIIALFSSRSINFSISSFCLTERDSWFHPSLGSLVEYICIFCPCRQDRHSSSFFTLDAKWKNTRASKLTFSVFVALLTRKKDISSYDCVST